MEWAKFPSAFSPYDLANIVKPIPAIMIWIVNSIWSNVLEKSCSAHSLFFYYRIYWIYKCNHITLQAFNISKWLVPASFRPQPSNGPTCIGKGSRENSNIIMILRFNSLDIFLLLIFYSISFHTSLDLTWSLYKKDFFRYNKNKKIQQIDTRTLLLGQLSIHVKIMGD